MNAKQKLAAAVVCLLAVLTVVSGPIAWWKVNHLPGTGQAPAPKSVVHGAVTPTDISGVAYNPTAHATRHKLGGSDAIRLDEFALPTAAVALNSQKITGLAAGTASGDAVHFGQTVTTSTNGLEPASDFTLFSQVARDGMRSGYIGIPEDFIAAATSATPTDNTIVNFTLPWRARLATGTAAVTLVNTNQDSTHWGIVQLSRGTTAGGTSAIFRSSAAGAPITVGTGQALRMDWLIRIPTLSDGTNTWAPRFGLLDTNITTAPSNGIYFEHVSGTSANWRGIVNNAGTPTVASGGSNVAVAAGAWIHLLWTWDGTTATFAVDGTTIGTATATPGAAVFECASLIGSVGTADRTVLIDAEQFQPIWSPSRAQ